LCEQRNICPKCLKLVSLISLLFFHAILYSPTHFKRFSFEAIKIVFQLSPKGIDHFHAPIVAHFVRKKNIIVIFNQSDQNQQQNNRHGLDTFLWISKRHRMKK
jgi:hypothetical protein